jgi:hypothetical protein
MFANADRYPGYWFSCELLLFFLFPLLRLLIAGIDDDDGSSSSWNRPFGEKEKNDRACSKHPHIQRRVDHRMSLLVATTFLPCSLLFFWIRRSRKKRERKRREGKKSFTQSVMPEDAANFADWLVRACMLP